MKNYPGILLAFFLLISSCIKEKANQVLVTNRTPEENKIIQLADNQNYRYPDGFNITNVGYYENTISVTRLSERKNSWHELSTNDRAQALAWSDSSDKYSSDHRAVIFEIETEKYFEIKRQSTSNVNDVLFSRVHKTSYFLPLFDLFNPLDTIGVYHGQLDSSKAKEFVEYLWSGGTIGDCSCKVIESQMIEYDDYFGQHIESFNVTGSGDSGGWDSIFVHDNYFRLDKHTRMLTFTSKVVDAFAGNE